MIKIYLVCVLFLLGISLPSSQAVNPDDEEYAGNESLESFLTELEKHTGLEAFTPNHTVTVSCSNPELTECIVNPNGTIVWDIRYFSFNNKYYQQPDGLATESSLSLFLANVFMDSLKNNHIVSDDNPKILHWFREQLYAAHMMENFEDQTNIKITLDGCLKYNSNDVTAYISCMQQVRESMITFLSNEFDSRFKTVLEGDCSLATDNCVQ